MKAQVPEGIYSSMQDIIESMNYAAKTVESHISWKYANIMGSKVSMKLDCKENSCSTTHYVNFSDKLRRILGFDIHNKRRDLIQLDSPRNIFLAAYMVL